MPLAEALILEKGRPMEIIALDEALDRLQEKDPRAAKVVEWDRAADGKAPQVARIAGQHAELQPYLSNFVAREAAQYLSLRNLR
jgi:hypothetical protein